MNPWEADRQPDRRSDRSSWWMLLILCLIGVSSIVDRQVINVLVDPIRTDLGLSDLQMGLIQGASFGVFYAALALPLAFVADLGDRRRLIAACLLLWSVTTILGGFATSFGMLLATRMIVGVGEAGLNPAAFSLLADRFPPRRLGRALGIFMSSLALSTGLSILAGGALATWFASSSIHTWSGLSPWRLTMVAVALPAPFLAILLLGTTREPPRRLPPTKRGLFFAPLWREMMLSRGFLIVVTLGSSASMIHQYAQLSWFPTYLTRQQGLLAADIAYTFAPVVMAAGTAGALMGGAFADRIYPRLGAMAPLATLIVTTFGALLQAVAPLMTSLSGSLVLFGLGFLCFSATNPLAPMLIQLIVGSHICARVSGLWLTVVQLTGLCVGPLAVPLIARLGWSGRPEAVGTAIAITSAVSLGTAIVLFLSAAVVGGHALTERHRSLLEAR